MGPSDAQSPASGSPRSRTSSSCRRIIAVRMPRRRCVAATPTVVTPAIGSSPPGMDTGIVNAPAVPTMSAPSNAARGRPGWWTGRRVSLSPCAEPSWRARPPARTTRSNSSAVVGRISTSIVPSSFGKRYVSVRVRLPRGRMLVQMTETETEIQEYRWQGRGGPFTILLTRDVFAPTYTSKEVASGLVVNQGDTVMDIGCGSGILSFVAASLGADRVYGTEGNARAVDIAKRNADLLDVADRVEFRHGSLFEPLKGLRANVVIGDVSGIPDDIAAVSDWFPDGYTGGAAAREG